MNHELSAMPGNDVARWPHVGTAGFGSSRSSCNRLLTVLTGAALLAGAICSSERAPAATASFSAAQVERGRTAYQVHCAMCHGAHLEGIDAPALTGPAIAQRFGSAVPLFNYFSATMPPFAPGQLGEKTYLDIMAYILGANGAQPGVHDLEIRNLTDVDLGEQVSAPHLGNVPGVATKVATKIAVPQAFTWGRELPRHAFPDGQPDLLAQKIVTVIPDRIAPANGERIQSMRTMRSYAPVSDELLRDPPSGEWLMWRRTLDNQGYSPLDQINRKNVTDLELAWAWPMAEDGQQQTAPLVHDGIMFIATTDDIVQALDAITGDLIWEYRHVLPELPASMGYQRYQARRQKGCIALYQDKVILATADAKLVALDALTGRIVWQIQAFDSARGYGYTIGPLVAGGKIISGVSGCTIAGSAGGCYIAAHDASDGHELWRFNTLDDPDNPLQQASWGAVPPANRWGGTAWATGSFDPRTNTTFWGTGNPAPYTELVRGTGSGAALYTDSTLALDVRTGKLKWYYQHLPRDNWDLDSTFERVLVDGNVDGKLRHMLVTVAGKNGIVFALDRDTGRFLWSGATSFQNVVTSIGDSGVVHVNENLIPRALGEEKFICPSVWGGKSWQAGAYSPLTELFYVPVAESCNTLAPVRAEFTAGNYVGSIVAGPRVLPPGVKDAGVVDAIRIADGKRQWRHSQRPVITSSLLTTGGGLVFGGDAARYIEALDQLTGEVLWKKRLNAPIGGYPMTYEIDGVQYLAVPTGYSAQAASAAALFPEFPLPSGAGNSLFVFRLRPSSRH
ncbi:MAG: Outer membrane protein assembly factor BamB [Steroidobacteraceae bacterium]|nr:Outer membrane protein assembly factor BamB [Steroidobacteraceae bacterium]